MRPESGAAEAVKAPKARAHVEMTSATVWRVRFLKWVSDFMVFPFFLIVWFHGVRRERAIQVIT
jgi:hypothetical protein